MRRGVTPRNPPVAPAALPPRHRSRRSGAGAATGPAQHVDVGPPATARCGHGGGTPMSTRFHEPFLSGRELEYLEDVLASGSFGGNAKFTGLVQQWLESYTGSPRVLFTHSCTGALELAALVLDLQPGDEVIVPSYTFCATASAFLRTGAKIVFCEIDPEHFDLDVDDVA